MDNFKFIIFSIIIIALLGLAGFWAVSSLESGSDHVYNQEFKDLKDKNEELEKQIANLSRENDLLKTEKETSQKISDTAQVDSNPKPEDTLPVTPKTTTNTTKSSNTTTTSKISSYKYQTLINELQKLVDNNTYLKLKSEGPAVGSVQKFLNIYKPNSIKVDNDYGVTTVNIVKEYQKSQKLNADGEVGQGTLKNMINWLKSKK